MLSRIRSALTGRYLIERLLGRGATATVYLARDLKHGRRVALKVMEPDVVNTLGSHRFLQEIRTTARLNHPNILPLFDSGEADGFIFYTMPAVDGDSLRSQLDRAGCMPPEAVFAIARQMAGALSYAHNSGIVHRDIKPENVLLDDRGHAWIADFGLARARAGTADQRLTTRGAAVGSPSYMSPEQAAGESNVDGRSDIYSFACVLYEMLTGEPPFSAHSVSAVLARHLSEPAPPVRQLCPDATAGMEAALQRAMAKDPAHRFRDAQEFVAALQQSAGAEDAAALPPIPARKPRGRRILDLQRAPSWRWAAAAAVIAIVGLALAEDPLRMLHGPGVAGTADNGRFLILPVERSETAAMDEELLLHNAFARWRDVDVVAGAELARALDPLQGRVPAVSDYQTLGGEARAGRIVQTRVSAFGDSVRIDATLFDRAGDRVAAHSVQLPRADPRPDLHFSRLADALLFPGRTALDRGSPGTDSRAAQQDFLAGLAAISEWDLPRADSLLQSAVKAEPSFSRAYAWRAQVLFWNGESDSAVRLAAEQALATADVGSTRAVPMAEALVAMSRKDFPAACARYGDMLEADPRDYVANRGLADCHGLDLMVLPDAASPTGWAFRSSAHLALLHYRRAFELLPASHRAYRHGRFLQLRRNIFYTGVSAHREGVSAAGEAFMAWPGWNDTLVFHPVTRTAVSAGYVPATTSSTEAVNHLRRIFLDVTGRWVDAYPQSADALEAHATAMELTGDTRATETLHRARNHAVDAEHAVNLSISEFWLRLKAGVPHAPAEVRRARLLADSILLYAGGLQPETARRVAAVAAVTGRAHRAARLAGSSPEAVALPLAVAEPSAVLLAYAAAGPFNDSVAAYETRVETAIRNRLRREQAPQARAELLGRPAALALPHHRMRYMDDPEGSGDYLIAAISASGRGDRNAVRRTFEALAASRAVFRPADLKVEALLPETRLLLDMDDPAAARNWLAPTLDDLRYVEPGVFEDVAAAGPLTRAMLLRAEIAAELNDDATARRWAAAAAELWTHADAELTPLRQRAILLSRNDD